MSARLDTALALLRAAWLTNARERQGCRSCHWFREPRPYVGPTAPGGCRKPTLCRGLDWMQLRRLDACLYWERPR